MIKRLKLDIERAENGYIVITTFDGSDINDYSSVTFISEDLTNAMLYANRFIQHGHIRLANENDQESL